MGDEAVAQAAERLRGLLDDFQNPHGHGPGHAALGSMLRHELGQMDPEVPSNLCQSLTVETNSIQFSTFSSKSQTKYDA